MKARIAVEVRRANIPDDIAVAIQDAIEAYQGERFFFSEAINDFPTVAGQEFYGVDDAAAIGLLTKLDYVKCFIGTLPYTLDPLMPARIEYLSADGTNQGQPLSYCYYAQQIRFWPIPNDVFTIRLGGQFVPPAPAADTDIGNKWMVEAERLIRSRAKYELALHRLKAPDLAQTMTAACDDAKETLIRTTNKKDQQGDWSIIPTTF